MNFFIGLFACLLTFMVVVEACIHFEELVSNLKLLLKGPIFGYPLYLTFNIIVMLILELPSKLLNSVVKSFIYLFKNNLKLDKNLITIIQYTLGLFMGFLLIYCVVLIIADIFDFKFGLVLHIDINSILLGINIFSILIIGCVKQLWVSKLFIVLALMTSLHAYIRISNAFKLKKNNSV